MSFFAKDVFYHFIARYAHSKRYSRTMLRIMCQNRTAYRVRHPIQNSTSMFFHQCYWNKNNLPYFLFMLLSCFVKKVTKEDDKGRRIPISSSPMPPPLKTAKHAPQARGLELYSVVSFHFIILYFLCRVIFIIHLFLYKNFTSNPY